MADAPSPIVSTPSQPGQPYDATSMASVGGWSKVVSGPASIQTGRQTGGDFDSSGAWKQC